MKKTFLAIPLSVLLFTQTHAFEAHTCPRILTCDGDTGLCDQSGWILDISQAHGIFTGKKDIAVSQISALKQGSGDDAVYQFQCGYTYEKKDGMDSRFTLYRYVKTLEGDWEYSGFGKQVASCKTVDPADCVGND